MPVTVEFERIDGSTLTQTTENGIEISRLAIVRGLTGDGHDKIYNALSATGMPALYDAHPAVATCLLREIRCKPFDSDSVECTLIYRESQWSFTPGTETQIELGSSVQQVETNKDKSSNDLKVSHSWTAAEKARHFGDSVPTGLADPDIQGGQVTHFKPQTSLVLTKRQSSSPLSDSQAYVGKVNSGTWQGGAAGTWLCTGINGRSSDNGDHYDVVYSFQYAPEGWNPYYTYLMPDGKPPETTDTSSRKQADLYNTANFHNLPI